MIENEMERFREHEKEFKMKQYSKRALMQDHERQGNFVDYSWNSDGSYDSESYGDDIYSDSNESGS